MNRNKMELNEYQKRAMTTCMDSCENFSYMMLNLVGEVGEFASKVAKSIRKDKAIFGKNGDLSLCHQDSHFGLEMEEELKKEAGDILWQLSGLCEIMDWKLEDIAEMNLEKLASRAKRGVISGDGDNR